MAVEVSWNDRFFASLPCGPGSAGMLLALLLVVLILVASALFGDLFAFLDAEGSLWRSRDARIALVVALLAAYLPMARRYVTLELRERLPEIGALAGQRLSPLAPTTRDGLLGLLLVPLVALAIDGRPAMYLEAGYWRVETAWHWGVGCFVTWNSGMLIGSAVRELRRVSAVAEAIPSIDLLDLSVLRPFARLGQRLALYQIGIAAIFSMNVIEFELAAAIALIFAFTLSYAVICVALPALGAHRRIRTQKEREIEGVNRAIRGDEAALVGTALEARRGDLRVVDLLAYRQTIERVSEWPVDAPMRLRLLLYAAIPVVSWFGGVVVEWLLERVVG